MSWRLAESLKTLRTQLNTMFPKRSKVSDGSIGDTAHSRRKSDHNPNSAGVVQAIDITHDPQNGVDCHYLAQALIESKDKRIKYLIWGGNITERDAEGIIYRWSKYKGKNRHDHHLHISVKNEPSLYDSTNEWKVSVHKPRTDAADKSALHLQSDAPLVAEAKAEAGAASPVFHTVASGNTLWGIAKMHGTSIDEIRRLNGISPNNSLIKLGQKLRVK